MQQWTRKRRAANKEIRCTPILSKTMGRLITRFGHMTKKNKGNMQLVSRPAPKHVTSIVTTLPITVSLITPEFPHAFLVGNKKSYMHLR